MHELIIEKLLSMSRSFGVEDAAKVVLNEPRFALWSGSGKPGQHHYRDGGLAEHTNEVIDLCLLNNNYFSDSKRVPENQLFLAALFHDCGKMWDYVKEEQHEVMVWTGSPHKRNIHHISRSAIVWHETATKFQLPYIDDVLHAILAHHGQREWGSPVLPNTRLAWLLHLCDNLSAQMDVPLRK